MNPINIEKLNKGEIEFISSMALGFISSYSNLKGEIKISDDENKKEILEEIHICKMLLSKFQI